MTDDNGINITKWSKKKLISEYKGYYQLINDIGCYGTRDLINFDNIEMEIDRRDYTIHQSISVE